MNINYSGLCNHLRIIRINDDFVRCQQCGLSMVNKKNQPNNKTINDFTKENKSFLKNFDKHFTNVIEEVDVYSSKPLYEYYVDKLMMNKIIVNKNTQYLSLPPQYEVIVNNKKTTMTDQQIYKLLSDINAIRIDEKSFKNINRKN